MLSKYCEPQGVIFFQFLFYYLTSLYPVHEKTRWTHHHKYANLTKCFDCGLRCDAKVNPTLSFPCLVCFFKSTHGIHWTKNSLWIALEHFALKRFKDLIKSILNTSFSADNFFFIRIDSKPKNRTSYLDFDRNILWWKTTWSKINISYFPSTFYIFNSKLKLTINLRIWLNWVGQTWKKSAERYSRFTEWTIKYLTIFLYLQTIDVIND